MPLLKDLSSNQKTTILVEFVKQILENYPGTEVIKLKSIIKKEQQEYEEKRERIEKKVREAVQDFKIKPEYEIKKEENAISKPRIILPKKPTVLRLPEPKLPSHLQYLKPKISDIEIDLGKLNPYLKDPMVRAIECQGPDKKVIVMVPSPRYTNIILSNEEIQNIVEVFEKQSKIPATGGIYKVVVGNLIFSAIVSNVIGTKFSIKKVKYSPKF